MNFDDIRKMIGIISGNTVGIAIWILLWAGRSYSVLVCILTLLIVSGLSIGLVLYYFEEDTSKSKRLFTKTSPFGFACGISLFLFLFIEEDLFEVIIFVTLMVILLIINYILIKKKFIWYKPD